MVGPVGVKVLEAKGGRTHELLQRLRVAGQDAAVVRLDVDVAFWCWEMGGEAMIRW